ncbi:ATP-binding protein [Candidatus Palauibacter sp.]|uniref:ATP-binding protein n=1 Tax=Candidatus Palauibacter sp. TaxID=3101350 RepID=UPI003AF1F957
MNLRKAGGNWVEGDRFFDREVEIEALMERVGDGIHTLVTAQRRMGKTSLVRELLRRLRVQGDFATVFVDLEDAVTAADAVVEIAAAARGVRSTWGRMTDWIGQSSSAAVDRIEELGMSELRVKLRARVDAGNWRTKGDAVFASLAESGRPVVLAIDELPILVNRLLQGHDFEMTPERRRDADEFLSWLRKNGQAHGRRIPMIVSGSVGLEPILKRAELSAHANIFAPFDLKPWDEETAIECLGALAGSYDLQLPEEVCRRMCRRLRCCVPQHVQQFFDKFHEYLRRAGRREATPDDVSQVYSQEMLGVRGQIHLEHYESRLRMVLGDEGYSVAIDLLTETAAGGGVLGEQSIAQCGAYLSSLPDRVTVRVADVLHVLEHDGYLARLEDGYRFVSGLVEDWWRGRHSHGFVPFDRRLN